MKNQHVANLLFLGFMVATGTISASPNIKFAGTIPAYVQLNNGTQNNTRAFNASVHPANASAKNLKPITLERIELSQEAKNFLANSVNKPATAYFSAAAKSSLPASSLLGMNSVPVLDQGKHGSCVTFADTGAIDAAHGKTDYISQLCNLELGSYLEAKYAKQGIEYPSGWEGSSNQIVLNQIQKYGIETMSYQKQYGCGSKHNAIKKYPLDDENNLGVPMSDRDFTAHSVSIMQDIYWKTLLNDDDAFSSKVNMNTVLHNVKQAITNGHRVVFGTLLDVNDDLLYVNGAAGTYNNKDNDSWIVTDNIKSDLTNDLVKAGHAMIITGYDDNAEIIGPNNTRHKGVLTLRNSWSKDAGDSGDYYMSYEYFKLLVMEVQEISPTPFTN